MTNSCFIDTADLSLSLADDLETRVFVDDKVMISIVRIESADRAQCNEERSPMSLINYPMQRPVLDEAELAVWRTIPTSIISDELNRSGTADGSIRPVSDRPAMVGQAFTAVLNIRSNKRRFPPHRPFGGHQRTQSWNIINQGSDDRVLPVLMTEVIKLKKGDAFYYVRSGGSGFADPLDRDAERTVKDIREETVSPEHARVAFGVAVCETAEDTAATEALRSEFRSQSTAVELRRLPT